MHLLYASVIANVAIRNKADAIKNRPVIAHGAVLFCLRLARDLLHIVERVHVSQSSFRQRLTHIVHVEAQDA